MKKITLFLLLSLCAIFIAGAQQERTATATRSVKSLNPNNGSNRAVSTIYDTSHASTLGAEITAAANGPATSMADAIVLAGTNRILKTVTVDVFNIASSAPYNLTLRIFTDCTSNGAANSICGSGPGTLIAGSTVTQNVTPPATLGTVHTVTFTLPDVDLSGQVDNTITVSLNASRNDVFWIIGETPTIGAQPAGEPALSVVERCGSVVANNGCARSFGIQNNFAMTLQADSPPPSGPISACGTGNPRPIPAVGTTGLMTPCVTAVAETGIIGTDYTIDNVTLNLIHTFAGDLEIVLVSPSGTRVALCTDNGGSTGLDVATNLVFTDASANNVTGWTANAPLANYRAEGGLNTFPVATANGPGVYLNTIFSGQSITGNWTLDINDDVGGDVGTLNSFCINFSAIAIVIGNVPVIACPADIVTNNDPGTCGAIVNFAGVAFDIEDGNISGDIIATPASGSVFPVGDTTVTLSVTDSDGNTSTCEFNVSVIDNENPVAICQDITVEIDPSTGTATITAADLNNGSTDNCGIASYALGIDSPPSTGSLATLYAGGNGGSNGGAVYFDLTVGPNDIDVTSIDVNTGEAGTITLNVYTLIGTYVGNTTSPAPWGAVAATGTGAAAGAGNPSTVTLASPLSLSAGTTYGIALVIDNTHAFDYTNGNGSNENYSNADLSLALGGASNVPFTAPTFSPRIFNGGINYSVAAGTVPFDGIFDCSHIGTNTVSLVVTDTFGNSSTCTSTVTVQDTTPPQIVCIGGFGAFTESEDFEGATIPTGWTTEIQAGSQDWAFGSGNLPIGDDFPTNAAIFNDDAAGNGSTNLVRLISPAYDLTNAQNVVLGYDVAFQEFGDQIFTVEVFDGSAWQQVALYDANLDPDIQTQSFDVSAFANPAFQVRFVYDDQGGWGWHAGVDNFSLAYEASTGNGLDVFLDANGMASINPNDLLSSVDEACGYTITAGGTGGGTTESLTTTFIGGNGNFGNMFDVNSITDVTIDSFDIHADTGATFDVEVYAKTGTWVGFEADPAAWTLIGTAPGVVSNGAGVATPLNLTLAYEMAAGETHAFYVTPTDFSTGGFAYTNGTATGNVFASDANIEFLEGGARGYPFSGSTFQPRVFNGNIIYTTGGGSGLDFTCDDLGENLIEVTVTDNSGNSSTCIAIVNVFDITAPIITCGPQPTVSETVSDSPSLPITDNFPNGVSSTISITDDVIISDIDINLDVTHTWVGDITTIITSPAGTSVTIVDRIGYTGSGFGCNGDNILATLDDAAASAIETQCGAGIPSISGTFTPNNPLSAFNGESTLGDWTITISDNAGGDTGTLNAWGITYSYANSNTDVVIELGPDGTADIDPYDIISSVVEACGIDTAAVDVPTVTCDDIGTTILVTVFVTDASGNLASCSANVTVVDLLGPELTCPADQTVDPGAGNLFYIVPDYFATGEATADDNCTDPVTNTTQDPAAGSAIPDGIYTVTLTATDEYGNTSTCDFELTVDSILGVNQNNLDAGVSLYPNPAKNIVNLMNKTNIALEKMMIYDINGKLVSQTNLRNMQSQQAVDVSFLASGVYVVQIIGENASTVKRLIKE